MPSRNHQNSISIVVPFYNEEDAVAYFFQAVVPIIESITNDYEIICIDDGSSDNTLALLKDEQKRNPSIRVISLSRNFGKEASLTAGIDKASKSVVIPMDADLQDPPRVIPLMVEKWREGYDVVLARRKSRNEGVLRRLVGFIYHRIIAKLTNHNIPADIGDFRLMDRKVIEAIKLMPEKTRYMKGIFAWVGFRSTTIDYDRPKRSFGQTKFNFCKLLGLGLDGIFSFSTKPLQVWLYIGLFISCLTFLYAVFLVLRTILYGIDLPGYASIMVSMLFMGGVQLISLGVIGEYIARIYNETKQRPIYIVREEYGKQETEQKGI